MKIFIETNQRTSHMLIFVFIYQLKNIVKINYVNSVHCKIAKYILKRRSTYYEITQRKFFKQKKTSICKLF